MIDRSLETPSRWLMCLLAAGAISCGKTSAPSPVLGYSPVDDMEGEDGRIRWLPAAGWPADRQSGAWSSATDCTQADRILPEPYFLPTSRWTYDPVPAPYPTMPGVTSQHAAHLRTKFREALQDVWGANIGFDFSERLGVDSGIPGPPTDLDAGTASDGPGCRQGSSRDFNGAMVDLRAYAGITFWAMASSSGRQSIRVQINDQHTDPRGEFCAADGRSETRYCYNGFAKDIMLTGEFRQYWIDFSELRQDPSWGYQPVPSQLDLEHVYAMNFEVPLPGCNTDEKATCAGPHAAVTFDVWIDDLYFINR